MDRSPGETPESRAVFALSSVFPFGVAREHIIFVPLLIPMSLR